MEWSRSDSSGPTPSPPPQLFKMIDYLVLLTSKVRLKGVTKIILNPKADYQAPSKS